MIDQTLPIDAIKIPVMQALQQGNIVVEAATGSGKSTHLPLWCAEQGRVLVVEPRRIACRSLARHVAELSGETVGEKIGYAIRFDSCYRDESQIVFVTPGIALSWLAEGQLDKFDLVILDEFHERRWDTDLLIALLKQRQRHRLVVTSATVEGERLAHYLDGQRLQAEGRTYPVAVQYTSIDQLPSLRDLELRVAEQVRQCLKAYMEGDILVFLPGRGEIEAAMAQLKGKIAAEVLPLHATVDSQLQDKVLALGGERRVILATNVAETSLTIPGVRVVIDSGLERRTHHRGGRTVLGLHPISQAAADQRAGRAGRLGPGDCVRLWGKGVPLAPFTPPEVLREELTELLLAAAAANMSVDMLHFPDPLPQHAVDRAVGRLSDMGAIDDKGFLTDHGRRLAPLPLDALFAHLISAMPDEQSCAAMIDLAAALSVGRRILKPVNNEEVLKQLSEWQPIPCDATTLIKMLREVIPAAIPIDPQALKEAKRIANDVRRSLGLNGIEKGEAIPRDTLISHAVKALPELAFVRRSKRRHALGNGYSEVEVSRDSRFSDESEAAVVFDQHSMPGRGTRDTRNFATCMAPISFQQLVAQGIGEVEYGAPYWQDDELLIEQSIKYAGRTLATRQQHPCGDVLRCALSELILNGKLMAPLGERLQQEIEAWNLYLHLGNGEGESYQPSEWLQNQLALLGVELAEDMALIEPQDVRFEGIPQWEREEFMVSFPHHLNLENMKVDVEYRPASKWIILHYVRGIRKTAPQRKELPRWSGWKIRFKCASREIDVR